MRRLLSAATSLALLALAQSTPGSQTSEPDSNRAQIPAELVRQLFADDATSTSTRRRPFKIEELASVLNEPRFKDAKVRRKLTERYLKLTYPAGPIPVSSLLSLDIPAEAQDLLFNAPVGSVQFSLPDNFSAVLDVLVQLDSGPRSAFLNASHNVVLIPQAMELSVDDLARLTREKYMKLVPFWGANIYVHNHTQERYLSSSPSSGHVLAKLLDRFKLQSTPCSMTVASCTEKLCKSKADGNVFGTLEFNSGEGLLISPDDTIRASCKYSTMFRREYEDRIELEINFNQCDLLMLNGESVDALDGLLRDLVADP